MGEKDKDQEGTEEEETIEEETEETKEEQETETEEELSVEELRAQLAKKKKDLAAANKEAKDRRIRLEALEKEKKDREEAELSEAEKLKKRAADAEEERDRIKQENHSLKLSQEFDSEVRELKLSFVSEKARETGLKLLDRESIGEDLAGLPDAVKSLHKDHAYLFGKPDPNQVNNDGSRKGKTQVSTVTRKKIDQNKRRLAPL